MKAPGSFNFEKKPKKMSGCRACQYNEIGVCKKTGRDVPLTSHQSNTFPKWCPKDKK